MSKRIDAIEESGIRKIFAKAANLKDMFNLSIGQPDFEVPVKEDLIKAIKENKTGYTPSIGINELRDKIKSKYNNTGDVIITTGASGGIFLVYSSILNEDDEIIIFDPYFLMYPNVAKFLKIKPVIVETNDDYSINFSLLEKAITKRTKAIMLNSPNNPTGKIITKNELEEISKIAKKNNLWIISDEIYEDYDYDDKFTSINNIYNKAIIIGGFSKNMAMTGLRLGYVVAPDIDDIMNQMVKLQQYTFVCAPSICQYAVADNFKININAQIKEFEERRELVYTKLKEHFDIQKPDGAFYFFIKCPTKKDGTLISGTEFANKCLEKKLLIVPGEPFSLKDDHFRICYTINKKELETALDVLIDVKNSI
jgi:aspartate aminotransferase